MKILGVPLEVVLFTLIVAIIASLPSFYFFYVLKTDIQKLKPVVVVERVVESSPSALVKPSPTILKEASLSGRVR